MFATPELFFEELASVAADLLVEVEVFPPHGPALGRIFGCLHLNDGFLEPSGHVLPLLGFHAPEHVALVVEEVRDGADLKPVGEEIQGLELKNLVRR